jgi:hypothetical protein
MIVTRMRRWVLESSWLTVRKTWRSMGHRMSHQKKKKNKKKMRS